MSGDQSGDARVRESIDILERQVALDFSEPNSVWRLPTDPNTGEIARLLVDRPVITGYYTKVQMVAERQFGRSTSEFMLLFSKNPDLVSIVGDPGDGPALWDVQQMISAVAHSRYVTPKTTIVVTGSVVLLEAAAALGMKFDKPARETLLRWAFEDPRQIEHAIVIALVASGDPEAKRFFRDEFTQGSRKDHTLRVMPSPRYHLLPGFDYMRNDVRAKLANIVLDDETSQFTPNDLLNMRLRPLSGKHKEFREAMVGLVLLAQLGSPNSDALLASRAVRGTNPSLMLSTTVRDLMIANQMDVNPDPNSEISTFGRIMRSRELGATAVVAAFAIFNAATERKGKWMGAAAVLATSTVGAKLARRDGFYPRLY